MVGNEASPWRREESRRSNKSNVFQYHIWKLWHMFLSREHFAKSNTNFKIDQRKETRATVLHIHGINEYLFKTYSFSKHIYFRCWLFVVCAFRCDYELCVDWNINWVIYRGFIQLNHHIENRPNKCVNSTFWIKIDLLKIPKFSHSFFNY